MIGETLFLVENNDKRAYIIVQYYYYFYENRKKRNFKILYFFNTNITLSFGR